MCAIDAAGSCGSNPHLFIAIRDIPPELSPLFTPYIQRIWILFGALDASRSCGWNPGLFIAIGRLVVEFSPLFHAVYRMNLDIVWRNAIDAARACGWFERRSIDWNWTVGNFNPFRTRGPTSNNNECI
jgi:hypothetical protein